MSLGFGVDIRERWAARSMRVIKWHVHDTLHTNAPVCDVAIDGAVRPIVGPRGQPADGCAILTSFVAEGNEIGPWGSLLEYTPHYPVGRWSLHASARRPLRRREEYPRAFLSYRREDADAYAGRLHETLSSGFGRNQVFMTSSASDLERSTLGPSSKRSRTPP